jgi:hypothetical protein
MRSAALFAVLTLVAISCGGTASAGHSPSPVASSSPPASPAASPSASPAAGSYGLLLSAGTLEMVAPNGTIAAHASVAAPSVHTCGQGTGTVLQPPVSATADKVFFRDGNTQIKYLTPDGQTGNATTVPGGASKVSFFSVSPDDQRIAVLVEDLSPASQINISLYVEDLNGGGNHSVIYTSSAPKLKNGNTLWPMGWHQGELVLAVYPPCTFEPAGITPSEWHVSNAVTAVRIATIHSTNCNLSAAPSPAGVGCIDPQGVTTLYDWTGKATSVTGPGVQGAGYSVTGLSPTAESIYFAVGAGIGAPAPATRIVQLGPGPYATVQGHAACGWIDEDHLLAPDAVIQFPAETPGNVQVTAKVTALAASGLCAGRFPGGL